MNTLRGGKGFRELSIIIVLLSCMLSTSVFAEDTDPDFTTTQTNINTLQAVEVGLPGGVSKPKGVIGEILAKMFSANGKIGTRYLSIFPLGSQTIDPVYISGATITGLNANNITSGTINTARLPSDVVKTTGNQIIAGTKTFSSSIVANGGITRAGQLDISATGNGIIRLNTFGQERIRVKGDGNVGIGNTDPNQRLTVGGNISSRSPTPEIYLQESDRIGVPGNRGWWSMKSNSDIFSITSRVILENTGWSNEFTELELRGAEMRVWGPIRSGSNNSDKIELSYLLGRDNTSNATTGYTNSNIVIGDTNALNIPVVTNGYSGYNYIFGRSNIITGQGRTVIGYGNTSTSTANNSITIGNSLSNSIADSIMIGNGSGNILVSVTGNIGIGNSSPAYDLDVTGNANFTGVLGVGTSVPDANVGVKIGVTSTNAGKFNIYGLNSVGGTSTTDRSNYGIWNRTTSTAANGIFSSTLYGAFNDAEYNTTTTGTGIRDAFGAYNRAYNSNTADMRNFYGSYNQVHANSAGDIDSAFGVYGYSRANNAATIVDNSYGGYFVSQQTAGTINNSYGVYIGTVSGTNKYGLYQATAAADNYFAGNVGIGIASPTEKLHVSGNVLAAGYFYTSDERLKKNIEDAPGIEVVTQLQGRKFTWKDTNRNDYGLVAQEVEKVLPELVHTGSGGIKSVEYGNVVSVLIEAIKDQQVQINDLQKQIQSLK